MTTNKPASTVYVRTKPRRGAAAAARTPAANRRSDDSGAAPRPSLSMYYADRRLTPAAFLRMTERAAIVSFDASDIAQAEVDLDETDPKLARTVALIGRGPRKGPLALWVTRATRLALSRALPADDADDRDPRRLFGRVIGRCDVDLRGDDKSLRARARNLIRLVLVWLIVNRNLEGVDALTALSRLGAGERRRTIRALETVVEQAIRKSSFARLTELSALASVLSDRNTENVRARDEAIRTVRSTQARIATLTTELRETEAALDAERANLASVQAQLAAAQETMRADRKNASLDLTQVTARQRAFLSSRLRPPLYDAVNALTAYQPPEVKAARQRLDMALRAIDEQMERLNERA